jgi:hypothetical protein
VTTSEYVVTACSCLHRKGLKPKLYQYIEPTLDFLLFLSSESLFILMTNCPGHCRSVAWGLSGDEVYG